jgi:hypothetical protein
MSFILSKQVRETVAYMVTMVHYRGFRGIPAYQVVYLHAVRVTIDWVWIGECIH